MSSRRCDDVGNGQLGDGEHSSDHCQKFSSSKVVNEADKIVVPSSESVKILKEKEKVCVVSASEKLPPSRIVQKKLNDSPGPLGFPPKSSLVEEEETTEEDVRPLQNY